MSKKLLEEGSVRSFMKLANLEPLAEEFVKENYMEGEEEGEPMDDEPEMDAPEPEMDAPEPEMDAAPAGGAENEEVFKNIVSQLADALGVEASIDGDEGEMEMGDDELEMDDEGGEEMMENELSGLTTEDLVAELESRGAVTLEEEEDEEDKKDKEDAVMQEAVEAISKRVAKRLFRK